MDTPICVSYPGIPDSRDALFPSDSQYTVLTYKANFPPNAQVDFQAEIILYNLTYVLPPDGNPTPAPQNYKYGYTLVETSDWSATQTLTIPGSSPSPSIPEFPSWIILLFANSTILIAAITVRRKKKR